MRTQALQRQRLHVWSVRDARSVVGAFALRDNTLRCFYSRFAEKGTEARRNARLLPQENRRAPLCGRPSQLCGAERRTRRSVLCYCKVLQAARGPLRPGPTWGDHDGAERTGHGRAFTQTAQPRSAERALEWERVRAAGAENPTWPFRELPFANSVDERLMRKDLFLRRVLPRDQFPFEFLGSR